jgi:O-antigen/teichoic acid export membrane protein
MLLGSNLLATVVGGLFFLTASHSFDLAGMGLYIVAITTQGIGVALIGTGLNVATVRLMTDFLNKGDRAAAAGTVALAAMTAASLSLLAAVLSLGLMLLSSNKLLLSGELLALVALWVGARSVLDCLLAGLLGQQQFTRASLLVGVSALSGFIGLAVVVLGGPFTLGRLLMAHVLSLGMSAVAAVGFILPLWRSGVNISRKQWWELLSYARWPVLSQGTTSLQANLGPYVLMALAGSESVGVFGLGRYPAVMFNVVALTLYQSWLPRAAQQAAEGQVGHFLGRQMKLAGLVGLGMLLSALASCPLLPWLGSNFAVAAPLFVLSTLDFALVVSIRPIDAVYHGLHKPHLELLLRVSRLILLLAAAFMLVPQFGTMGMVWAQVLSSFMGIGLAVWLIWRQVDLAIRKQVLDSLQQW